MATDENDPEPRSELDAEGIPDLEGPLPSKQLENRTPATNLQIVRVSTDAEQLQQPALVRQQAQHAAISARASMDSSPALPFGRR